MKKLYSEIGVKCQECKGSNFTVYGIYELSKVGKINSEIQCIEFMHCNNPACSMHEEIIGGKKAHRLFKQSIKQIIKEKRKLPACEKRFK